MDKLRWGEWSNAHDCPKVKIYKNTRNSCINFKIKKQPLKASQKNKKKNLLDFWEI